MGFGVSKNSMTQGLAVLQFSGLKVSPFGSSRELELSGFTVSCDGMLGFTGAIFYFFKVLMCSNCFEVLQLKVLYFLFMGLWGLRAFGAYGFTFPTYMRRAHMWELLNGTVDLDC